MLALSSCSPSGKEETGDLKKAPDFQLAILQSPEKASFHLALANDSKPVLLVFWATWCPSCKEEIPLLNQLVQAYGKKIEIASINVGEEAQDVQKFLTQNKIDFRVLLDPDSRVSELFEVSVLPSVLLLAKGGEILYYGFRLPDKEKLEAVLTV